MGESANPLMDAALGYARVGLAVFPCAPGRKTPLTEKGFCDATTDEATIRKWWRANPRANIGMPTGARSGLVILDIDPRNGGEAGFAELQALHEPLPPTAETATGSGGRHLFIQQPGGHVPCSQSELAAGVDVKGDGGYIVLPPSLHPTGDAYEWESDPIATVTPIVCPAWLAALIQKSPNPTPAQVSDEEGNPIPEGQRNSTLARLGGAMRRHGMSGSEILAALQVTNQARCRPPVSDAEVQRIAMSVARYAPDAVSVALVEDHYEQIFGPCRPEKPRGDVSPHDPGIVSDELLRVPGFISEVMDHCLDIAPYPNTVMAFSGALALQALLAGRRVRDPGDNRTNLYLLALAHSSAGKDSPRKINTEILNAVGLTDCMGGGLASGEGVQDALFANPCMLFQTDEIDSILQSINKSKDARHENIMSTLLMMYSSASTVFPMRRKAGKESPGVIDQPCLTLLGTAIPEHYYQALSERMLTNGFFARMIILECGHRAPGQEPKIKPLPPRILETAQWWADFRPGRGNLEHWHPVPEIVPHTQEAQQIVIETRLEAEAEYAKAEGAGDSVGTTVWGRVSENARKLALLYAVSEDHKRREIGKPAAEWARQFVMHQTRRMLHMARSYVADNPFHAECLKLMQKLRAAPGRELTHSILLKRMKTDAKSFAVLIETLTQQGSVEVVTTPRAGWHARSYRLSEGETPSEGET